jgi:3-oxoadipate enol-lactonase
MTTPTILGPIYVDDSGSPGQPVALLWPSLFTDHRMWDPQVAALRAAGWRTISLDPPGHGRSPGPRRRFTMDECAEVAVQVLDAAQVQTPAVLIGTSWGGIVAPRVALRAPDRVKALVLFNTSADRPTWFSQSSGMLLAGLLEIGVLDQMVDRMVMSLQLAPGTRRRDPGLGRELAARFRSWDRRAVINAVRSVLVDRDGFIGALPAVSAAALIVSGERDTILPSVFSQRMVERMPHARHVEVPGAAHLTPLEAPDIANNLIRDFLKTSPDEQGAARGSRVAVLPV